MSATATATTSVELTDAVGWASSRPTGTSTGGGITSRAKPTAGLPSRSGTSSSDTDEEILAASRAVDSAAPDGGYGWAIVASGCVLMWWGVGTTYAWGVVQRVLVRDGLAGPAVVSFIGSLQAATVSLCATANAWLLQRLGPRRTALAGVALMGGSEILSGWATKSLGALFVTSGVMFGLGASFIFCVITAIPSQYFSKKRGLANGLIFAGSGLGGAAISFALDPLIDKIGLAMAYRVLGLTTLATGLPAAWIMKERTRLPRRKFIDWTLFKSADFVLICAATAIGTFPLYVPPFFLPLYADSLGLSSATGAGLVAGFTLSSAAGRVLCGGLCDVLGAVNVLLISLLLTALSMLAIWPASTTLAPLALFVVVNGLSNGGFFCTMPTVASNVFGSARVGMVMSMIITGWIGGYLMGAPIAGYLLEAFGGAEKGLTAYRPAMLYGGSLSLFSAFLVLIARLRVNKKVFVKV
ncbi:Major facilitator superfamily transporter [Cordyceps fumosorosea ARSEF 2679]|uniref:Major facilitator superfamily transporter n=1 Tax=Cordyceps fumosorosea (strain ARSEF 2679) TaxID=1081104 RepID=A0A167WKF9_CORFA|nr:Major facilitator superfamily transporter [Cordyceps fumosorosea ARSEF 2679]OAA63905.1 Major facilitator superfamily transporter [Cordyceps fumosorosea ARSEF 2679]